MPRWVSYVVTLIATVALLSAGTYVMSRWYAWDSVATVAMFALKWSLILVVVSAAYGVFVGLYHTFLSVTGLDQPRS